MTRRLRILAYTIAGGIGLVLAACMAFWLMLAWHTWPKSWHAGEGDFLSVAMPPLAVCGPISSALRVTDYYRKNNFNDGDELWRLEVRDANAVADLLGKLRMAAAHPKEHLPRFLSVMADKPDWVVRPQAETKWLFVALDPHSSDGARGCMHGRLYLWSVDGKVFFLYHLIS